MLTFYVYSLSITFFKNYFIKYLFNVCILFEIVLKQINNELFFKILFELLQSLFLCIVYFK